MREVIIPRGIANMLLCHHTVPLAMSHYLIIIMTELSITLETLGYSVSPLIGIWIIGICQNLIHSLGVIHIIEVGHCLNGEEDRLAISITSLLWNLGKQSQCTTLQTGIVVSHLAPLSRSHIIGLCIQHLRSYTSHVLAIAVVDRGGFLGNGIAEYSTEEATGMISNRLLRVFLRVPRHVHKQLDGIFHRFQVTHIQNPHPLDAIIVSQRKLFEHLLCLGHIDPLGVTGSTHVIYMVIQSPSTRMLAFLRIRNTAHISPVVVTQQHDNIIGHAHSFIIIV